MNDFLRLYINDKSSSRAKATHKLVSRVTESMEYNIRPRRYLVYIARKRLLQSRVEI